MNTKSAATGRDTVDRLMTQVPWTVIPSQTLAELVNQVMLRHAVSFVPVVEGAVVLGYIDTHILQKIDRENWASTKVGDVFVARDLHNCVAPDARAVKLLGRIRAGGTHKFLVVDGENLAGVITLSDLVGHLVEFPEAGPANEASNASGNCH